jgi:hypothetical protein
VAGAAGAILVAVHRIGVDGLGAQWPATPRTDPDDAAALAVAEDHGGKLPVILRRRNSRL